MRSDVGPSHELALGPRDRQLRYILVRDHSCGVPGSRPDGARPLMSNPACGETGTPWAALAPLYAAGFVGAFGATGIATMLAGHTVAGQVNLFTLGLLLAAYPAAVLLLKSVFAAWANRVGARPVLLGGLTAFALASVSFAVAGNPVLVGVARFAQGAAAAAFYPAATITVAHLSRTAQPVRAFGSHAAWLTLGFMLGLVVRVLALRVVSLAGANGDWRLAPRLALGLIAAAAEGNTAAPRVSAPPVLAGAVLLAAGVVLEMWFWVRALRGRPRAHAAADQGHEAHAPPGLRGRHLEAVEGEGAGGEGAHGVSLSPEIKRCARRPR